MGKSLCVASMVVAILVFLLFFSDLLLKLTGLVSLAPFKGANPAIDIVFSICAAVLGFLSWTTLRDYLR
jgi:hypothetical protein